MNYIKIEKRVKMARRKTNKEQDLDIIRLYNEGYNLEKLAYMFNVSEQTIRNRLYEYRNMTIDSKKIDKDIQKSTYPKTKYKQQNKFNTKNNVLRTNNNDKFKHIQDYNHFEDSDGIYQNHYEKSNTRQYDYFNFNFSKMIIYIIPIMIFSLIMSIIFPNYLKKDIKITTLDLKNGQYIGQNILKKANGYGRLFMNNNDKYVGEFKSNKMKGLGALFIDDNYELIGSFEDNKAQDLCLYQSNIDTQETFIGYYKNGKKDGIGITINGLDFNIFNYKNDKVKKEIARGNFAYIESIEILDKSSGFSVINHEDRTFISKLKDNEFDNFTLSIGEISNPEMLDITVDDYNGKKSICQITFNNINNYYYIKKNNTINKEGNIFFIGNLKNGNLNGLGIQYNYDIDNQYAHIGYYSNSSLRGNVYTIDKYGSVTSKKKY